MTGALRDEEVAARLGGDEFAVLLEDLSSFEEALRAGERLLLALSRPERRAPARRLHPPG